MIDQVQANKQTVYDSVWHISNVGRKIKDHLYLLRVRYDIEVTAFVYLEIERAYLFTKVDKSAF